MSKLQWCRGFTVGRSTGTRWLQFPLFVCVFSTAVCGLTLAAEQGDRERVQELLASTRSRLEGLENYEFKTKTTHRSWERPEQAGDPYVSEFTSTFIRSGERWRWDRDGWRVAEDGAIVINQETYIVGAERAVNWRRGTNLAQIGPPDYDKVMLMKGSAIRWADVYGFMLDMLPRPELPEDLEFALTRREDGLLEAVITWLHVDDGRLAPVLLFPLCNDKSNNLNAPHRGSEMNRKDRPRRRIHAAEEAR